MKRDKTIVIVVKTLKEEKAIKTGWKLILWLLVFLLVLTIAVIIILLFKINDLLSLILINVLIILVGTYMLVRIKQTKE